MLNLVKQAEERAETVKVKSKHRVYNVLDIAGYVVNTNIDKGIRMRRYRLDLFLYFIQGYSYLLTEEPIFDAPVLVRNFKWPYTEWMDNYFGNKYRIRSMPKIAIYWDTRNGAAKLGKRKFNPHITMSDRELLDTIIDELNAISNKTLRNMLVNQGLTKQALEREDRTITERMMITYCERVRKFGLPVKAYIDECLRVL